MCPDDLWLWVQMAVHFLCYFQDHSHLGHQTRGAQPKEMPWLGWLTGGVHRPLCQRRGRLLMDRPSLLWSHGQTLRITSVSFVHWCRRDLCGDCIFSRLKLVPVLPGARLPGISSKTIIRVRNKVRVFHDDFQTLGSMLWLWQRSSVWGKLGEISRQCSLHRALVPTAA